MIFFLFASYRKAYTTSLRLIVKKGELPKKILVYIIYTTISPYFYLSLHLYLFSQSLKSLFLILSLRFLEYASIFKYAAMSK